IRDLTVTGVQTCALPICLPQHLRAVRRGGDYFIGRRTDRPLLERDLLQIDFQLLREDLVNRIDLEEPARRRIHAFVPPAGCGSRSEERRVGKECRVVWWR